MGKVKSRDRSLEWLSPAILAVNVFVAIVLFFGSLAAVIQLGLLPPEQRLLLQGSIMVSIVSSVWGIFTAFALFKVALDVREIRQEPAA